MELNQIKCSVNPSNLVSPVKVNERFSSKFDNGINIISNDRKKYSSNTNTNYEYDFTEDFVTSKKNYIKILVSPNMIKYSLRNKIDFY